MHIISSNGMRIVHAGLSWPFHDVEPSSRDAIKSLERNEAYITWMQPAAGAVDDQFPTIKIDGRGYYVLSLRCMKVVFRHVRLRKNFTNLEQNSCGEWKLKIPTCLMREKMRTQGRFNVGGVLRHRMPLPQQQQLPPMTPQQTERGTPNVAVKIKAFLDSTMFPLAVACSATQPLPESVDFVATEADALNNMMQVARSECPSLLASRSHFVERSAHAFDVMVMMASSAKQVEPQRCEHEQARETLKDVEERELGV